MLSKSSSRFLRRLNCVLFVFAITLLVPYGVESSEYHRYYEWQVPLFPTLGLIPSGISAITSLMAILKEKDVEKWPNWWLMASFVVDFVLSGAFLGVIITSYAVITQNDKRSLMVLGVHGTIILLVQLLSHIHLAISAIHHLGSRSGPCPHCGHGSSCAQLPGFKGFYHSFRGDRDHDPEDGRDSVEGVAPARIALPLTAPKFRGLEGKPEDQKRRVFAAILAGAFSPTFIHPHNRLLIAGLAILLSTAIFNIVMSTEYAKKMRSEKPFVYWLVAALDGALAVCNLVISIIGSFTIRHSHPGVFVMLMLGVYHLYLAGSAIKDYLEGKGGRRSSPVSLSIYEEPVATHFSDNSPSRGSNGSLVQVPAEPERQSMETEERPSVDATESQTLLGPKQSPDNRTEDL